MADRYPLVYNSSANQLQELQSGDSLDLGNAGLKNVTTITAVGFKTSTGTSAQFLKADGSIDSNTYLTSAGTVALAEGLTGSPNITISNVTGANGTFSSNITAGGNITAVDATFTGNVSIAGTITYDDVTHVDSQGIGTFRQGIEVVGHSEIDALRVSGVSTFQNNVDLPDNVKLNIGTGDDLQIYHDGTNSYIRDEGIGQLRLTSSRFEVRNPGDNKVSISAFPAGEVALYYDNSKKLETTGVGATVIGDLQVSGNANVGSAITMYASAGIVSATAFYGDGSKLTGVAAAGGGALDITSCLFI